MTATSLIAKLRAAGVSMTVCEGRLVIEAPRGTIAPEMRTVLAARKSELITALGSEQQLSAATTEAALKEIAELFATAFRRSSRILRLPANQPSEVRHQGLAICASPSVHERG